MNNFPALFLILMSLACAAIVIRAQRREDFDWAEALRDDNGKVSAMRLAVLVCLTISSWMLVALSLRDDVSWRELFYFYAAYLVVWSGAKIVEKVLDVVVRIKLERQP